MRIVVAVFIAGVLLAGCGGGDGSSDGERDQAVTAAQSAFEQSRAAGDDLSTGPCISESLPGLSDWVADVAHDPRQDIDDDPANQCQRYRDGEANHFVELNPQGELIRAE